MATRKPTLSGARTPTTRKPRQRTLTEEEKIQARLDPNLPGKASLEEPAAEEDFDEDEDMDQDDEDFEDDEPEPVKPAAKRRPATVDQAMTAAKVAPGEKPYKYSYVYAPQRRTFANGTPQQLRPVHSEFHPRHPRMDGFVSIAEGYVAKVYKTKEVAQKIASGVLIEITAADYARAEQALSADIAEQRLGQAKDLPFRVGTDVGFAPDLDDEFSMLGLPDGIVVKLERKFGVVSELVEAMESGRDWAKEAALTERQEILTQSKMEDSGKVAVRNR